MMTLEEIYRLEPTQKVIDDGADWGAKEMLKAGVPIYYRSEAYPETLKGDFFVKEYPSRVVIFLNGLQSWVNPKHIQHSFFKDVLTS